MAPETSGEPYCPACGNLRCYVLARGQHFKCSAKECRKEFTVTSGTIFASRKLKFREILIVIAMSANGAKGKAALQVARELGVQTKTAWLNLMKLREALAARRGQMLLDDHVEIDGMYLAGHIRPENRKEDREDRRKDSVAAAGGRDGGARTSFDRADAHSRDPDRERRLCLGHGPVARVSPSPRLRRRTSRL
jgi:transposase-like protein